MSENEYLMPLTERERRILLSLIPELGPDEELYLLFVRIDALEPIGTGGTTEGA